MATIELEPTITDDGVDEPPGNEAHLIRKNGLGKKEMACGRPFSVNKHPRHGPHMIPWTKGQMACPVCGMPICMDCLLAVS